MTEILGYSREDIEFFVTKNLTILGEDMQTHAQMVKNHYADILEALPAWRQTIIIERDTPTYIGNSDAINKAWKETNPSSESLVNGFFTAMNGAVYWQIEGRKGKPQLTARHEFGHHLSWMLGQEQETIQKQSDDPEFQKAVKNEIACRTFENAPFRRLIHNIAKRLRIKPDQLYPGARELTEHLALPHYEDESTHPEEALAEIVNHHDTLYEQHQGNSEKVDEILSRAYTKLWPAFRDRVIPLGKDAAARLQTDRTARIERLVERYAKLASKNHREQLCTIPNDNPAEKEERRETSKEKARHIFKNRGSRGIVSAIQETKKQQENWQVFHSTVLDIQNLAQESGHIYLPDENGADDIFQLYEHILETQDIEKIHEFNKNFGHGVAEGYRNIIEAYCRHAFFAHQNSSASDNSRNSIMAFGEKTVEEIIKLAVSGGYDSLEEQAIHLSTAQTPAELAISIPENT